MVRKQFISRGFPEVTEEMRVLVSAAVIKLTLGLPEVYLPHFDKILIYPDAFYSLMGQKYHLGEVNPRLGTIVLSWKSFVTGFADRGDAINLGIHEMAHALRFENSIKNHEYGFLNRRALYELDEIALREMMKINQGTGHFFRYYAGKNVHEFFAVALEYFFEQPHRMQQYLPDLYDVLKVLLNQDTVLLKRRSMDK